MNNQFNHRLNAVIFRLIVQKYSVLYLPKPYFAVLLSTASESDLSLPDGSDFSLKAKNL